MLSHVPTPDRSPTVQVNIKRLIDAVQCYQTVRELRWPDGIACPSCQPTQVIKRGCDDTRNRHGSAMSVAPVTNALRSYWIPGAYAPALSEKGNSFRSIYSSL